MNHLTRRPRYLFAILFLGLAVLLAGSVAPPAEGRVFSYRAPAGTRLVAVAGSFNRWSTTEHRMADADGDGVWTVEISLPAGRHEYKFVRNATEWIADPSNPLKGDDGMGGENSIVEVAVSEVPVAAPSAASPAATPSGASKAVFTFRPAAGARSVTVAGSFNNWNSNANPLADADGDGIWTADVALAPGVYQYKFVVNGSDWLVDPANPKKAEDGLGGENSVLTVGAAGAAAPVASGAPSATAAASAASAASAVPGSTRFSFRAPAGARSVTVAGEFNNWNSNANPLTDPDGDGVWTADVQLRPGKYQYKFVVNGSDWMIDPANPKKTEDGLGGENSLVEVTAGGTPAATAPASTPARAGGTAFSVAAPNARSVELMGSWNGWSSPTACVKGSDGNWTATMNLNPGTYEYKFRQDGDWDALNKDNRTITVPVGGGAAATAGSTPAPATPGATRFSFRAPAGARSVTVAGEFNNWNSNANPLTDPDGDGVWTADVQLRPGKYQYKFVVNGSDWLVDPANPKKTEDGLGGENSLVEVTAGGTTAAPVPASTPARAGGTVFSVAAPNARSVELMGSWNGWASPTACVKGADGTWTATMNLNPGTYEYKFRQDGDWDALNKDNRTITVPAGGGAAAAAGSTPAPAPPSGGTLFSFRAPAGARSVTVAGEFNGWNSNANPLTDPDGDGVWTATIQLRPGKYQYKFVVNGSDWTIDPANPKKTEDGLGGENSLIEVSMAAPAGAAEKPPGWTAFRFKPPPGARSVSLAGTFNNWDMNANRMFDLDNDGTWTTELVLPLTGHHEYKYVINGTDWVRDPENPRVAPDNQGGENSVVTAGEDVVAVSAPQPAASSSSPAASSLSPVAATTGTDLWAPERPHVFSYRPSAPARSVTVAGSFNNWSPTATSLSDPDGDGTWTTEIFLPPGTTVYKFVVDGNRWIPDPANPEKADDNYGSHNSIVRAGTSSPDVGSRRGDGVLDAASIEHARDARYRTRFAANGAIFRLRLDRDDADAVRVSVGGRLVPMLLLTRDDRYEYWQVSAAVPEETAPYLFMVKDGETIYSVTRDGAKPLSGASSPGPRFFELEPGHVVAPPSWIDGAVMYQVFPDRFANGDPANDPSGARAWRSEELPRGGSGWSARYGGDLAGIAQKLDYLSSLGVTVLKLNPILAAPSPNKYDVADYMKVDPEFGTNDDLRALCAAARARGIRVVLDGVFNHSGERHPFFQDAAKNGPASPYYAYYNIRKWPFPERFEGQGPNAPSNYYECWKNFGWLPAWNTENEATRAYLFSSVAQWMEMGVAGWRLDAADEVESSFWCAFRREVKGRDRDAYIVGEIWPEGWPWLHGDQFDATTNYPLRSLVLDYIVTGKKDAAAFATEVAGLFARLPAQAHAMQYNHLSSHDVPRLMTLAGGDVRKVRLAVAFQFSHPGLPVVYYGDEVGLSGGEDPDNRRAFPWNDESSWNRDLLEFTRLLARLRRDHEVLRRATWLPVAAEGRRLVVASQGGKEDMILVLNASDAGGEDLAVDLPAGFTGGTFRDLLSESRLETDGKRAIIPRQAPWAVHFFVTSH